MTICEQLKGEYLNALTALINEWKENSVRLRNEGSNDEAIIETIKVNVGEIFYKMFNISYNSSCKNVEVAPVEMKKLNSAYLAFFEKIPAPWKEKALKDKEHNMMEEYYKEQIKLEVIEEIKNLFFKYYERIDR